MAFTLFCIAQFVFMGVAFLASYIVINERDSSPATMILSVIMGGGTMGVLNAVLLHYAYGFNIVGWWS